MAHVYDRLMEDAPYAHWQSYTREMINAYLPGASSILDLGCGTGEITRRLHEDGFRVTGVDLSSDMLTIAQQKSPASIQWLHQDITNLEGLTGYDCVVSYCDVLNYLVDPEQVTQAFANAFEALRPQGLFLFDVHSVEHVEQHLLGQTFAEVYDDVSFIWFCDEGDQPNKVVHDLTFFVQQGATYERFDEQHVQRVYDLQDLKQWLKQTGFNIKQVSADFQTAPHTDGDRLFFVCQKP
ncbi:class I SAM-dependent DNA methyltransferase [Halobacillus salinus]|uniref:class I SAM-dependent DNA methyltransferase n=1 Tax=Halobacillus salinus TaxID=192814 RepID=UPI0011169D91|nr:class I SAM-dependent methyltransferase [Halobacillus salinus]